jgi:hypothetical protein
MQEKTLFKIVLEMKMLSEIMFGFFVCCCFSDFEYLVGVIVIIAQTVT